MSDKSLKIVTIVALIGFAILTIIFQIQDVQLTAASGYGILDLEFAFNQSTATTILAAWGPTLSPTVILGTYLDFLYIVSYSVLIMGVALLLIRKLEDRLQTVGMIISISGFIAGVFDVVENINLINMLNNPASFSSFVPTLASICASIKFFLIFAALGFALIALLVMLLKRRQ
ncbi:MAG: hypothetical protein ACTSRC_10985 [Candidatus Helarchaeota archaeon]